MGSQSMKALRFVQYGAPYKLEDIPIPTISDNQLLVKVEAAGFRHTDHQIYNGVYNSPLPVTPSHEPAGNIVAIEQNVTGSWKPGQRIGMLNFRSACHACVGCEVGRDPLRPDEPDTRFCENKENAGVNADGAFAEYVVADPATSMLLPDGLSFEQAAPLMCAGATVWTSLADAGIELHLPIGVIGVGGLGYLALQFAAGLGHPTVAIDNRPEGRQLASELPAHLKPANVVDYNSLKATNEVVEFAGGGGLAAVLVCTRQRARDGMEPYTPPASLKLIVRGSLVANQRLLSDMMNFVAEKGVRSHVQTVKLEEAMDLPDRYMDPHLKGRLVVVP